MKQQAILAALVASVMDAAAEMGLGAAALAAEAGLDAAALDDPDGLVPLPLYLNLWERLAHRADGLALGRHIGLRGVGGVGLSMRHGATVGEAIGWLQRYGAVVHPDVVPRIEREGVGAGARFVFVHAVPLPFLRLREPVYAYASGLVATLSSLSGRPVRPVSVVFPLTRPADPERFSRFFDCPVAWGGEVVAVAFDAALLALPVPGADPRLFRYLSQRAEKLMARPLAEESYAAQVRQAVEEALARGEPRLAPVARRLAVSERTLHRRLAAEGAGFAALVDDVRRERALALLEGGKVSGSEIAFMLGYGEAAAFFRAFKRWTGTTPQQHRRRAAAGSAG